VSAPMGEPMRVTLEIPAAPEYLRLARMASADAGSRAGLDYEEIDDLRIAVTELCHLVGGEGPGTLRLEFVVEDGRVEIDGSVSGATPGEPNEFSAAIISAVVDEHDVREGEGDRGFHLVKRHRG